MYLTKKIKAVEKAFRQLGAHISRFKKESNLNCVANCGACCSKPDIEATVMEFLPAAYFLYLTGEYNVVLNTIAAKQDNACIFYMPFARGGYCSNYQYRGLVCRLFGFSVSTDKQGAPVLVTCKPIKSSTDINKIKHTLRHAPEMSAYYLKLFGIDPKLTTHYFPINQAIKKALDMVLMHFQYTKKPA